MASDVERLRRDVSLSDIAARYGVKLERDGDEFVACCPFHAEETGSFTIFRGRNDGVERFHCFAGETRVITKAGVKAISELAGGVHTVLTKGGIWVDAPFLSFGVQRLMKIELSRNGVRKDVYATPGHRWFVRHYHHPVTTEKLRPGSRLEFALPSYSPREPSLEGIQHGYVFGDGTNHRRGTRAYIMGGNRQFMPAYFPGKVIREYSDRMIVEGLPAGWKGFPTTDDAEYLTGFLAGFIAADGHVAKDGTICLNQARREVLERVRDIATSLGIVTFPITEQVRCGIDGKDGSLFRIHIASSTVSPAMILNPELRKRLEKSTKKFERHRWSVVSVSGTDREEEVYCAQVPETHSFALEDFILTGNCFGCGQRGDVLDFIMGIEGIQKLPEAIEILGGKRSTGKPIEPRKVQVRDVYEGIIPLDPPADPIEAGKRIRLYNPKRKGSEREWGSFAPSMVFPYRRLDGSLIGYVLRHELPDGGKETPMVMWVCLPDGKETWCRFPFPKPRPLYGLDKLGDSKLVIVVEGEKCRDALRKATGRTVVSWPGGTQGVKHCDWSPLSGRNVVMWPDADEPGIATANEISAIVKGLDATPRVLDVMGEVA